jgi:hypothetical protein
MIRAALDGPCETPARGDYTPDSQSVPSRKLCYPALAASGLKFVTGDDRRLSRSTIRAVSRDFLSGLRQIAAGFPTRPIPRDSVEYVAQRSQMGTAQ